MITEDEVREIAAVFAKVGEARSEADVAQLTSDAAADSRAGKFFALLTHLDGKDLPVECRELGFFRFFPVNALIQAQRLRHALRMFVLRAIAVGLHEFARYFAYLENRSTRVAYDELPRDEKRYFAFGIVQLIEIGFGMDELLMTLKGDAYDQADAYELRRLREDGPDAFADSYLFDDHEKKLWNAVFDKGGPEAIAALQRYLIDTYAVPFVPAPEVSADA